MLKTTKGPVNIKAMERENKVTITDFTAKVLTLFNKFKIYRIFPDMQNKNRCSCPHDSH